MGLAAYLIWGSFPVYFKALVRVSPPEVLAHRIVWSAVFPLIFVALTGAGAQLKSLLADRRTVATLAVTTLLIATNWFVFIYAVTAGKVLESSLGYYINPLVSIFLAFRIPLSAGADRSSIPMEPASRAEEWSEPQAVHRLAAEAARRHLHNRS